jgi:hypothetical protein
MKARVFKDCVVQRRDQSPDSAGAASSSTPPIKPDCPVYKHQHQASNANGVLQLSPTGRHPFGPGRRHPPERPGAIILPVWRRNVWHQFCRDGASARLRTRGQWSHYGKLILILADRQAEATLRGGHCRQSDATVVLGKELRNFRLSVDSEDETNLGGRSRLEHWSHAPS